MNESLQRIKSYISTATERELESLINKIALRYTQGNGANFSCAAIVKYIEHTGISVYDE
jgi:hypothetical protein